MLPGEAFQRAPRHENKSVTCGALSQCERAGWRLPIAAKCKTH